QREPPGSTRRAPRRKRSRRRSLEYQPCSGAQTHATVIASTSAMRVAVTVEQSWHVVPGGIAVATVELLRALTARDGLDLVGAAAWHRRARAAGLVPPVPVRRFPLPRQVLYESWQRLRAPSVERATGRVDVVHDAGYVVPPSKAPLVATVHDLSFLTYPQHYTWPSAEGCRG